MACPYDAIIWMEDKKIVAKCTMCWQRLEKGEDPACVTTCFSRALQLLDREEIEKRDDLVKEIICFTYHDEVKPRIRFIKTKPGFSKEEEEE